MQVSLCSTCGSPKELIKRGKPSFVEVKGVTYCGTSKASTLTMKQVPFHEEVVKFTQVKTT